VVAAEQLIRKQIHQVVMEELTLVEAVEVVRTTLQTTKVEMVVREL
jgi:hypothetical protein